MKYERVLTFLVKNKDFEKLSFEVEDAIWYKLYKLQFENWILKNENLNYNNFKLFCSIY